MTVVIQKQKRKNEKNNNNNNNHSKIFHHIFLRLSLTLVCMCLCFVFVHLPFASCMTLSIHSSCISVTIYFLHFHSHSRAHWRESAFLLIPNNIKCMKRIISQSASTQNNGNYNRTVDAHNIHANGHAKVIRLQLLDNFHTKKANSTIRNSLLVMKDAVYDKQLIEG